MARISTAVLSFTIFIVVMAWVSELVSNQWIAIHEANAAYQKNAEYDRDKSADEIAEDCQDPDVVFRDCVRKNLESHYQDQATNKDLQAQQDMAFWAFWLLIASAAGIGISGFGVVLLIRSIGLGRDANIEATKAANAALASNEIMRKEKRPWVVLDREIECEFSDSGHAGQIAWNYNLENKGFGLAHDVKLEWDIVKRHHFQHMKAQLQVYLKEVLGKRGIQQMAVLFPHERTDNIRHGPDGWTRYREDSFTGDPEFFGPDVNFMLMVCVTYRLAENSDEFGFDVRMFHIDESDKFIGPWGHTILEYGNARLIG